MGVGVGGGQLGLIVDLACEGPPEAEKNPVMKPIVLCCTVSERL